MCCACTLVNKNIRQPKRGRNLFIILALWSWDSLVHSAGISQNRKCGKRNQKHYFTKKIRRNVTSSIHPTEDSSLLAELNEGVQNLHHELYPKEFKPTNKRQAKAAFERLLAKPEVFAFVAKEDEQTVGYVLCMIHQRSESEFQYEKISLIIDQIMVLDTNRRKGVASLLLERAVQLAKEKGITEMIMDHWDGNSAAGSFFARHDFQYFNHKMKRSIA